MLLDTHHGGDFLFMVTTRLEILIFVPSPKGFPLNFHLDRVVSSSDRGHVPLNLVELAFEVEPSGENSEQTACQDATSRDDAQFPVLRALLLRAHHTRILDEQRVEQSGAWGCLVDPQVVHVERQLKLLRADR